MLMRGRANTRERAQVNSLAQIHHARPRAETETTRLQKKNLLTRARRRLRLSLMKQRYHTIIKPERNGWFVGWVEEVPGTITQGKSLDECRRNLKDSLQLMIETHRDEARLGLDASCIQESIEVDVHEPQYTSSSAMA